MNAILYKSNTPLIMGARDPRRLRTPASTAEAELRRRQQDEKLDVSLGCVDYALKALFKRPLLKADNFCKLESKVTCLCGLTPEGIAEKTSLAISFLGRKLEGFEVLRQDIDVQAGEVASRDSAGSKRKV